MYIASELLKRGIWEKFTFCSTFYLMYKNRQDPPNLAFHRRSARNGPGQYWLTKARVGEIFLKKD